MVRGKLTHLTLLSVCLALGTCGRLAAQAKVAKGEEAAFSFRGRPANDEAFTLVGADVEDCLRFEPEGLRLNLPPGRARSFTGLRTGIVAQGDFELGVHFELLEEPTPPVPAKFATKLHVIVVFEREMAGLTRQVASWAKTPQWTVWLNPWQQKQMYQGFPATGRSGRLRVARVGETLAFAVAEEGGAFRTLREFPCRLEDVRDIRLVAETGSPDVKLDARITDFHIRADHLPQAGAVPAAAPGEVATAPPRSPWRLWLVLAVALICSAALMVSIWRRSRMAHVNTPTSS